MSEWTIDDCIAIARRAGEAIMQIYAQDFDVQAMSAAVSGESSDLA